MGIDELSKSLESQFAAAGPKTAVDFPAAILKEIERFLVTAIDLPPKAEFLEALANAIDRVFQTLDFPGPDAVIEPLIKSAILTLASFLFDQVSSRLDPDSGVVI